MTIQDAIKSGKPFKRPNHDLWMVVNQNEVFYDRSSFPEDRQFAVRPLIYQPVGLCVSAILADDWEVRE